MAAEQLGEIVIAPRVLEKIIAIATAKVEGVYSFANKSMSDSLSMRSLGRGVSLHTDETGDVTVDIYLYLEYGVSVPTVAVAIQKAVKSAVFDMAEVEPVCCQYPCGRHCSRKGTKARLERSI